jgi:hypothetical protein
MEVQFLHERFTEKDPKLLVDHIRRMASGEAPFFPTTLSLVYGKLVEKAFPKLTCASGVTSSSTINPASSSNLEIPAPTPRPAPLSSTTKWRWLKCVRCGENARLRELHNGLYCPRCSGNGKIGKVKRGRPFMLCLGCSRWRVTRLDECPKSECRGRFM